MTRIFTITVLFFLTLTVQAQNETTGSIAGKLTDKEMNGDPLPFANVLLKGTSDGATTDMNGLYELKSLEPGEYTLVFSFVGYESIEVPNVEVVAGKVTEVNTELGASAASLDEVVINTVARKDSEVALLLDQKKAIEIKESIGARELAKLGVSDVATATTRISGVSSSEASGDIFVRGLGDRYLYTTLNGLPIPSDDVERKNIDLELFPTGIIQSVGISKTYSPTTSADQASGNIDISTRELAGSKELSAGTGTGINTNVLKDGVFDNFKVSVNTKNTDFGFYTGGKASEYKLIYQDWTPQTAEFPVNTKLNVTAGKRFGKLEVLLTGSQDVSYEHTKGEFREFRANFINDSITDAETFSKTINTTGLATVEYEFNKDNQVRGNSLFINKLSDRVYEGGRNGEGYIYEETDPRDGLGQFVRDQNTKQTRLWINQVLGEHRITENNSLNWAAGINLVNADEPNRIRNEVNFNEEAVYLGNTGGYQQRKSYQEIDDQEFNGSLSDKVRILSGESKNLDISFGGNYRFKERDFISRFLGLEEASTGILTPSSIDNISEVFTEANLSNGTLEINNSLQADRYRANLESTAGFTMFNLEFNKWNINAGVRYQQDELEVAYNVGNIPGRTGSSSMTYDNFYPSLNLRYALNEKNNLRFASSRTLTLPEFKEVAPFEYVSQTGQVTRGNPALQASNNYNFDLKWEYFPSTGQLFSLTGFYKKIEDPINKVQDRGSAGVFSYFNAGKQAEIYGLELESRLDLISMKNGAAYDLNLGFNASRMWHSQDLKEVRDADGTFIRTFQYKGLTETGLQGASDWIFNGSLNLITGNKNPLMASLVANYASDKIYALGAPERQTESETFYNDAIVEKGFVTLNAVLSKEFGEHWSVKFTGKNLLNPEIERVQKIRPSTTGIETTETVRSYTRGAVLSLGVNYNF